MRKIKWGVLGTANIAQTQVIPAIIRAENAEITAISSTSGKAKEAAATFSISTFYNSYEELLQNKEIDAVYIPLPNHLHKKWVIEAAKQGKHILCEKPAALNAEEAKEMVDFCREKEVTFMEAFMYQFHPQHQRVREIIASGEIGKVKFMSSSFSFFLEDKETNIRMKKEMGGGSLYDVGCYCIHAIRTFLQSEPAEVEAYAELDPKTGVDLTANVYMKLQNGIPAMFSCSIDMASRQEYEIVGTKGRIIVPRAFRPDLYGGLGQIIIQTEKVVRKEKWTADLYKLEIEHFSQAIVDQTETAYTPEKTIRNMEAVESCYKSIKSKKIDN
ncbi:Gfo/Idh/MocA family protein [Neobacillus sp. SM06]|uniref:Gfo/Idh/MocA family protein n=1 Tax=Neobacillus sp. SM06 TaxID=3422492 RepID=UPI003D2D6BDF